MTRVPDPYEKAVAQFSRLMAASGGVDAGSIRSLARAAGIPSTTAQDMVTSLERLRLVTRTASGRVEQGNLSLEIGLSAFGFGRFAQAIAPVIELLRFQLGATAFAGLAFDGHLWLVATVGPNAARLRVNPIRLTGAVNGFPIHHDGMTLHLVEFAQNDMTRMVIGVAPFGQSDRSPDMDRALQSAREVLTTRTDGQP